MEPTPAEITRNHSDDPAVSGLERLPGGEHWAAPKQLDDHDPAWATDHTRVADLIRTALGDRVLELHHVGSTAVPGLPAKPVIDVDLVVADPTAEQSYVPDLVAAGFRLHAREPGWHQHRLLKLRDPFTHLHVFGPGCPEVVRHRLFRDWLTTHPEDRELYAAAKRAALAEHSAATPYTRLKEPVLQQIYQRMFEAHGLL